MSLHKENSRVRKTKRFRILEFDFEKRAWITLKSIDGRALFLGENTSVCVNAADYTGCRPNCVYFTHDIDLTRLTNDIGVYDIASGKIEHHFHINPDIISSTRKRPPIWVVTTFNAF